jgi:copper resistance protein C
MSHQRSRAAATLLILIGAVLLAVASPASAHNELGSSNPKSGDQLDAAPAAVVLTFGEDLIPGQTTITITGPDGALASAGDAQLSGAVATIPLKPTAAGAYTVAYKVVADDGDVTDSSLKFTLTAAAIPTPTTTTTTTTTTSAAQTSAAPAAAQNTANEGTTWWPYLVGALVIILIVVIVVVMRRRRSTT